MMGGRKYASLGRVVYCLPWLVAVWVILSPGPVRSQVTDTNGYITTSNWLALGPFAQPFGCSGNSNDILCNHIAPSQIQCQYPEEGDEVEYDEALACSTGYVGPVSNGGLPHWRLLNDGVDDCLNNMDNDAGADVSDMVTFACTYFEYLGDGPIDVQVCVNSDDGRQVWIDDQLVHNENTSASCSAWGDCAAGVCDSVAAATVTPGQHRILVGNWERAGGWGFSLRLQYGPGNPVLDTDAEWIFTGIDPDGFSLPCAPATRTVTSFALEGCPPSAGPVGVTLAQDSGGLNPDEEVQIVETALGPFSATQVTAEHDGTVTDVFPRGMDDQSFVTSWLLLGPFTGPGGGAPALDVIRQDFLTDGDEIFEPEIAPGGIEPVAGDTVETDFGGAAASTGLTFQSGSVNPGGIPTWAAWHDTDDTIDFEHYYGSDTPDNCTMYALTYLRVEEDVDVQFCIGIDDSIQILIDGVEAHISAQEHGFGAAHECQETVPYGVLSAGYHTVLVKMIEGGGNHGFRLGFQDSLSGLPAEGISACLTPGDPAEGPCEVDPIGVQIVWNVTRSQVAAGVGYQIDIDLGSVSFSGTIDGGTIFGDNSVSISPQPPTNLACDLTSAGAVDVTWTICSVAGNHVILVNGAEVGMVAPDATSFTVEAGDLPDEGVATICVSNGTGTSCCGIATGAPLYINCGGPRLGPDGVVDLGDGRTWEEDSLANPSPFLVGPVNTSDFADDLACPLVWGPMNTMLLEPNFVDDPICSVLFATERWMDGGDVTYRIPLPVGDYDVTLLFAEGCCSEGCEDSDNPVGDPCRIFDILVNGDVVEERFAQHVEAQRALEELEPGLHTLPNAQWGVALAKGPYPVSGDEIEIIVRDLEPYGAGNPQNAAIKGIAIEPAGVQPGTGFRRADANGDGNLNITDGIFVLNYLFLGGPSPPCLEAANPDDDAQINITDGIYILNFLFLGGPDPLPPGPDTCGPDPAGSVSNLGCDAYTNC